MAAAPSGAVGDPGWIHHEGGTVHDVAVVAHACRERDVLCHVDAAADVGQMAVLLGLDRIGVAAHSGSACTSEPLEPSPVLEAMGVDAHHSLRLSVGWNTTDSDLKAALDALPGILAGLRSLR
jgi:cysteine sulfinate desulfinase/cysteine desulfurase-like protein